MSVQGFWPTHRIRKTWGPCFSTPNPSNKTINGGEGLEQQGGSKTPDANLSTPADSRLILSFPQIGGWIGGGGSGWFPICPQLRVQTPNYPNFTFCNSKTNPISAIQRPFTCSSNPISTKIHQTRIQRTFPPASGGALPKPGEKRSRPPRARARLEALKRGAHRRLCGDLPALAPGAGLHPQHLLARGKNPRNKNKKNSAGDLGQAEKLRPLSCFTTCVGPSKAVNRIWNLDRGFLFDHRR